MRYENPQEIMAAAEVNLCGGMIVKITKGKKAKKWKVVGLANPLPIFKNMTQHVLASRGKTIYVKPEQILEVLV